MPIRFLQKAQARLSRTDCCGEKNMQNEQNAAACGVFKNEGGLRLADMDFSFKDVLIKHTPVLRQDLSPSDNDRVQATVSDQP